MIRTLEELSMNAWPALQTMLYGGWVLRFANGYTRRANSINPIYPSTRGVEKKIAACEEIYRGRNLRVVYKMTRAVFPENLDAILEGKGYDIHDGKRIDWEAGDAAIVENSCVHQHFNADPQHEARIVIFKAKPLFIFFHLLFQRNVDYPPSEPMPGWENFKPEG